MTTTKLDGFRERLLVELLEHTSTPQHAPAGDRRPRRRRTRRGARAIVLAAGLAIGGSAVALSTAGGLSDIHFFGAGDRAAPASPVQAEALVAWWRANGPSPGTINTAGLRVLASARAPAGELRVYAAPTTGPEGVCEAVTVDTRVVSGDCLMAPPPDDRFLPDPRQAGPGERVFFPTADVAIATGYLPSRAVSVTVRTSDGVTIPTGHLNGVWVALITAGDVGVERLDVDHGSKARLELIARDADGRVVERRTDWGV